jgi:hypothetical protein
MCENKCQRDSIIHNLILKLPELVTQVLLTAAYIDSMHHLATFSMLERFNLNAKVTLLYVI